MGDYIFWTHGVGAEVEHTDGSLGLHIQRTGFGAKIRQDRGTSNWFHLGVPTPTLLDGAHAFQFSAFLRVDVNNDAVIKKVHVRKSIVRSPGYSSKVYDSGDINITGQVTSRSFKLPPGRITGPLVVCVYVEFEGDDGEIRLIGAGALFRSRE